MFLVALTSNVLTLHSFPLGTDFLRILLALRHVENRCGVCFFTVALLKFSFPHCWSTRTSLTRFPVTSNNFCFLSEVTVRPNRGSCCLVWENKWQLPEKSYLVYRFWASTAVIFWLSKSGWESSCSFPGVANCNFQTGPGSPPCLLLSKFVKCQPVLGILIWNHSLPLSFWAPLSVTQNWILCG